MFFCTEGVAVIIITAIEAATDRGIFFADLDEVLCPQLKAGTVVMMDNLSSHKVDGAMQRVGKCGATFLYLPPYSPDRNPIEKAWINSTTILCRKGPHHRSKQRLQGQ